MKDSDMTKKQSKMFTILYYILNLHLEYKKYMNKIKCNKKYVHCGHNQTNRKCLVPFG